MFQLFGNKAVGILQNIRGEISDRILPGIEVYIEIMSLDIIPVISFILNLVLAE